MRAPAYVLLILASTAFGCGGSIREEGEPGSETATDTPTDGRESGPDSGRPDVRPDSRPDTGVDTERDTFVDPGCPDAPPPPTEYKCDPFNPTACKAGEGCYPYVIYPTEPCEHERYGSVCYKAGTKKQGEPCGTGAGAECAAGFVCVVSGAGNQCVQLCKPGSPGVCPDGLVCSPIDVPGFGGCL